MLPIATLLDKGKYSSLGKNYPVFPFHSLSVLNPQLFGIYEIQEFQKISIPLLEGHILEILTGGCPQGPNYEVKLKLSEG